MAVFLLILGLVLFMGLVIVHEFGHFIAARRNGVEVEEFGLGFPPKLKTIAKRKGTDYTINLLPLGGFVRLKGEHDSDTTPGSYGASSSWTKVKIMLAGVVMNLFAAFVLLAFLALVGMPKLIDNQFTVARDTKVVKQDVLVGYVEPNSPADRAGLKPQDKLLAIGEAGLSSEGDAQIKTAEDLPHITQNFAGAEVRVLYERGGDSHEGKTRLLTTQEVDASKKTDNPKGYLGIVPTEYIIQRSTWSAPVVAAGFMKQVTILTFKGLGNAIAGIVQGNGSKASAQVSGPVGIFVLLRDGSLLGYQFILMIIAVISLTLAIMNVLPIPALDGGRLFVTLIFRALKRPLKQTTEEWIHGTGFALLMVLFILITIVDVKRFV